MKIYFPCSDVFNGPEQWLLQLQRVLLRAQIGQHDLIFAQADAVLASRFAQTHASTNNREWLEVLIHAVYHSDALDRSAEPGARPTSRHIDVSPSNSETKAASATIHPGQIGAWAEQPLRLILENDADRAIVDCTVRMYGQRAIEMAIVEGWLVFEHRGGVPEVRKRLAALPDHPPFERLIVLIDSDRPGVNEPLPKVQRDIQEACSRRGIPLHILAKRELENYAPQETLDIVSKRPARLRHLRRQYGKWKRLTAAEQDFVDIESHFDKQLKTDAREHLLLLNDQAAFERRAGFEFRDVVLPMIGDWL